MILELLSDALFAAIAGIGFGAVSNPPVRAFKFIAVLAAAGHAFRFFLMGVLSFDISMGSLFGAALIGFSSLWLARMALVPMTVLYIPALLPMVPGKFAYNMVFSQIMFMQNLDNPAARSKYMEMFFSNGMVTCTVIFMLAVGATLPIFFFPGRAYSVTRKRVCKNS